MLRATGHTGQLGMRLASSRPVAAPAKPGPSRLDEFDLWLRRSIIIAFVLGSLAHLVVTHVRAPRLDRGTLFADAMVLLGLLSAWGIARLPWQRYGRDLFAIVLLYSAVLIAGLVYSTGGPASPFGATFLLIAISAGLYHPTRIALLVAIACCGLGFLPLLYAAPTSDFLVQQIVLSGGIASTFLFQRMMLPELLRRARAEQQAQDDLRETRLLRDELARANAQLERQARTDALTGLPNHGAIIARADAEVAHAAREGGALALLFFDLDHFKRINDTHGHSAGDLVLSTLAQRAAATLPPAATLGRYGGEEFLAVLPGADEAAAQHAAEALRRALRENSVTLPNGVTLTATVSIGIATCHGDTCSRQALLNAADGALYAAKRNGRDRISVAPAAQHCADGAETAAD